MSLCTTSTFMKAYANIVMNIVPAKKMLSKLRRFAFLKPHSPRIIVVSFVHVCECIFNSGYCHR